MPGLDHGRRMKTASGALTGRRGMDAEYVSMREMMEKILLREHSADGGKRGTETETRPAWRPGGGAGGGDVLRSLDQGQQACLSRQSPYCEFNSLVHNIDTQTDCFPFWWWHPIQSL